MVRHPRVRHPDSSPQSRILGQPGELSLGTHDVWATTPLDLSRQKKRWILAEEVGALTSGVYLDKDRPSPRIWSSFLVLVQESHLLWMVYDDTDNCTKRGNLIPQSREIIRLVEGHRQSIQNLSGNQFSGPLNRGNVYRGTADIFNNSV